MIVISLMLNGPVQFSFKSCSDIHVVSVHRLKLVDITICKEKDYKACKEQLQSLAIIPYSEISLSHTWQYLVLTVHLTFLHTSCAVYHCGSMPSWLTSVPGVWEFPCVGVGEVPWRSESATHGQWDLCLGVREEASHRGMCCESTDWKSYASRFTASSSDLSCVWELRHHGRGKESVYKF